jgi:ketosteroid isomerase-like protein
VNRRQFALTAGAGVVLAAIPGVAGRAVAPAAQAESDRDFAAVLREVEAAQVELVRGRPDAFKALWSQDDDCTLVGGLGGAIETGWTGVSRRLDWVSSQYAGGTRKHEQVSTAVGADLAYVVQRETIRYRVPGETRERTQELRVTMVFRRQSGHWRIVHRHADSQLAREVRVQP